MTLKEIAALAGVSPAAVSRYLNGGSLRQEKRERIEEVIRQTGFKPNPLARDLRTGQVRQIGVIVPRILSTSASEVVAGVEEVIKDKGYLTVLCCTNNQIESEQDYIEELTSYRLAGLIVMAQTADAEQEQLYLSAGIPVVVTGQHFRSLDCVYHDDYHAMYALAQKMIEAGRKQFVYIGVADYDQAVGIERKAGAMDAMKNAGINAVQCICAEATFSVKSGYEAMKAFLAKEGRPDAVLCATDSIAHGAMLALKSSGFSIPEQVSVAGIGNSEANIISSPQMTAAKLFHYECGKKAASMLLDRIENGDENWTPRQIMMGYTITERGSI